MLMRTNALFITTLLSLGSASVAVGEVTHECRLQVDSRFEKEDGDYRNLEANIPVKSLEECVKAAKQAAEFKFKLDEGGSTHYGDLKSSYSKFIYKSGNIVFKGKYRLDSAASP